MLVKGDPVACTCFPACAGNCSAINCLILDVMGLCALAFNLWAAGSFLLFNFQMAFMLNVYDALCGATEACTAVD